MYSPVLTGAKLNQPGFAKFLKANADERAGLLERMTGTEIYSRVSRAAFARRKEKDEAVTRARQALARIAGLVEYRQGDGVNIASEVLDANLQALYDEANILKLPYFAEEHQGKELADFFDKVIDANVLA